MIEQKQNKLKLFLFPYYPRKFFHNTSLMVLIAAMLALRLVLSYVKIGFPIFGMNLSFSWFPVYIVGWLFGPIIGLFFGVLTDTLAYILKPGVWFWMYAIQEPLVGMFVGIFAGFYSLQKCKKNNIYFQVLIQKLIVIAFILIVLFVAAFNSELLNNKTFSGNSKINDIKLYVILTGVSLIIFYIGIEAISFYNFKRYKNNQTNTNYLLFSYISVLAIFMTILFSFILGPIVTGEYYKYMHNGRVNPKLIQYGLLWYLIPRIMKESVKTPIYIFLLYFVINAISFDYHKLLNLLRIKY